MLSRLYAWLDSRLKLEPVKETLLDEPIPGGASWIYVFGSATLFVFFLQAITGMFLAVYYAPTPDHAYDSIRYIETQVLFGPFVRGLHHWGASAMVVAIGLHMLQVFLYGAYKPPRELMWMVGVLLLLLTMGFAFTGYLLPWDQNAYWATQVGINMVGSVPFVGTFLVRVMRGGDTLGAQRVTPAHDPDQESADERDTADHVDPHLGSPVRVLVPGEQVAGEGKPHREQEQQDADHPHQLAGRLVRAVQEDLEHVQADGNHHRGGPPVMEAPHERAEQHLRFDVADAVVRVVGRRRIVDCQKHPRDRLEEKDEERGRTEDVDPGRAPGNRLVEQSLLDRLQFEPAIQPGVEAGEHG